MILSDTNEEIDFSELSKWRITLNNPNEKPSWWSHWEKELQKKRMEEKLREARRKELKEFVEKLGYEIRYEHPFDTDSYEFTATIKGGNKFFVKVVGVIIKIWPRYGYEASKYEQNINCITEEKIMEMSAEHIKSFKLKQDQIKKWKLEGDFRNDA